MSLARWAAVMLCLAALTAARAEEDEPEGWDVNTGKGPLLLRDQWLPSLAHLQLTPTDPRPTDKGCWRVGTTVDWMKTFTKKTDFVIDAETVETVPYARYGLLEGIEVGVDLPIHERGGGVMDPFINGFHDFFGVPQNGRDEVPDDTFIYSIADGRGHLLREEDTGWGLGNLQLESKLSLSQGDERLPALAVQAVLSVPTGEQSHKFAAGGVDGGLLVTASKGFWGKLYLTADAGGTAYSEGDLGSLELHSVRWFTMGAIEYQFSRPFSIVGQTSISAPYLDAARLDKVQYFFSLGFKFRFSDHVTGEFGALEHYGNYDVSADFGWHFGLEYGF